MTPTEAKWSERVRDWSTRVRRPGIAIWASRLKTEAASKPSTPMARVVRVRSAQVRQVGPASELEVAHSRNEWIESRRRSQNGTCCSPLASNSATKELRVKASTDDDPSAADRASGKTAEEFAAGQNFESTTLRYSVATRPSPDAYVATWRIFSHSARLRRVEHEAKERGVARTAEHLAMRQTRSKPLLEKLHTWLIEKKDTYLPKGGMGAAIRYALDNWTELTRFLDDVQVPPDNNRSEAALRVAALGRKNFLFVGHEDAGDNVAALYTLVSTCEAHGVNPFEYLRDVLMRVSTHPASDIDALLPHRWAPAAA